ncbi:autophagy-related protein 13 homolog isoform X2 [Cloeon dipterum]|uniref:autophagy-related protein 13 homolog isoform X2 n=1 Tax=Cloeon dipterum TaxID=197152 RepID=UPI00322009AC
MVEMACKLSEQDRTELEKYIKFLAIKAMQLIVQGRLGTRMATKCKPQSSGTDWFNLDIEDVPEVTAMTKGALAGNNHKLPICAEISLKTTEGDHMVLETWMLGITEPTETFSYSGKSKVTHAIYNRMTTLLKSLLTVSRATPPYKLSRRQGADSYLICYRIYSGEPQLHVLGEGKNQKRLGQLCTPLGTIVLSVAFRTKMTISPQQSKDIMVKSDHFNPDLSPKHTRYQNEQNGDNSLSKTIKAGAFADPNTRRPHSRLFTQDDDEIPFAKLLAPAAKPQTTDQDNGSRVQQDNAENNNTTSATKSISNSRRSSYSANDDFILLDLNPPFAEGNVNGELGAFYRQCQTAPPLQTFSSLPTLAEQVSTLSSQLEMFEESQAEFDALVNSLVSQPSLK